MPGVLTNEGYPGPPGHQPYSIVDVAGPASYTQVGIAVGAPTGGQSVLASALGFAVNVLFADTMGSDDGQYDVITLLSPFNSLQPSPGIILKWVVASTGAEVSGGVNLSARTVRIFAVGR